MPEYKPLYLWALMDAVNADEMQEWRSSFLENRNCARAIEQAIDSHYRQNRLEDCAEGILTQYGFDRVNWVLANTVQEKSHDGRFSPENKAWAKSFFIPCDESRWYFCIENHPGLTDLFINQVRQTWQRFGLYEKRHCVSEQDGEISYKNKVLVLNPRLLKESNRTPTNQLFFANGGFGCSPNSRGRKVFGRFLIDGDECFFYREDFLGAIKNEHLPAWVADRVAEMESCRDDESEITVKGGVQGENEDVSDQSPERCETHQIPWSR